MEKVFHFKSKNGDLQVVEEEQDKHHRKTLPSDSETMEHSGDLDNRHLPEALYCDT